jgi:hemerythrin
MTYRDDNQQDSLFVGRNTMPFMQWNSDLSVNIKLVDEQHMRLVAMVNKTWDIIQKRQATEVLTPIVTDLLDYTNHHFGTEEGLFRVHRYPRYLEHRKEHEDLAAKVQQMNFRLQRGNLDTTKLLEFLKTWLSDHIMGSDKKFGPFLVSKGLH